MGLLERINLSGTTIVMATHDRGIVDQMQKRVVEVSEGKIVRDAQTAGYREVPSDAIDQVGEK
jgi:cell division transport system ATP-binding protein